MAGKFRRLPRTAALQLCNCIMQECATRPFSLAHWRCANCVTLAKADSEALFDQVMQCDLVQSRYDQLARDNPFGQVYNDPFPVPDPPFSPGPIRSFRPPSPLPPLNGEPTDPPPANNCPSPPRSAR